MCMLHPDKPSNLSGPWVTNVANMITGIYADLRRHYVDLRRQYADLRRHFFRQISQISRNTYETQEHNFNFCVECLSISFRELGTLPERLAVSKLKHSSSTAPIPHLPKGYRSVC